MRPVHPRLEELEGKVAQRRGNAEVRPDPEHRLGVEDEREEEEDLLLRPGELLPERRDEELRSRLVSKVVPGGD